MNVGDYLLPRVHGTSEHSMIRAVLAYPLIFALAASPLLCCCTLGPASAAEVPAGSARSLPAPKHPEAGHSCCGHKQKAPPPEPKPAKPGHCPCKDGGSKVQATEQSPSAHDLLEKSRTSSPNHPVSMTVPAVYDASVDPALGDRPRCSSVFPSRAELLFSHHRLRC
jgi:hypothetical protein